MRIIANENITGSVINKLRATGHDVLSVKETMRGANDPDVLSRAQTEPCSCKKVRDNWDQSGLISGNHGCFWLLLRLFADFTFGEVCRHH